METDSASVKTAVVVGIAALVSGLVTVTTGIPAIGLPIHGSPLDIETVIQVKLFVTTLNAIVLLAILWNYLRVYRDLPNRFTLSLLLFTVALLLYAVSSNPLLPIILGFRHGTTLGPFMFLPDLFASIASIVLLYQSYS
ncbi:hypothetical protein [Halodesulfurarchaeum sp.]|uniref:hypothetical protein n=1 Tax=Halodesulfurarchaeum sp. TaxID=1980530 RepID=UPI002FC2C838